MALDYAAAKIASYNGDARTMIGIISKALELCKKSLSVEELASTVDKPVVKVMNMVKVLNTVGISSHVEIIKSLPSKVQTVLCVASALNQVNDTWKEICLHDLKKLCMRATKNGIIDEDMQSESFQGMVEQLEDAGLFASGELDGYYTTSYDNFMDRTIRVGAQLEDVKAAVNKSLLQISMYQEIFDRVRREVSLHMW